MVCWPPRQWLPRPTPSSPRAAVLERRQRTAGMRSLSRRRPYVPLLQRVAGVNVALVLAAVGVTVVVLAPSKLSAAIDEEVAVVVAAVALVVLANVYLLRR